MKNPQAVENGTLVLCARTPDAWVSLQETTEETEQRRGRVVAALGSSAEPIRTGARRGGRLYNNSVLSVFSCEK
jgi:hypothetical protein